MRTSTLLFLLLFLVFVDAGPDSAFSRLRRAAGAALLGNETPRAPAVEGCDDEPAMGAEAEALRARLRALRAQREGLARSKRAAARALRALDVRLRDLERVADGSDAGACGFESLRAALERRREDLLAERATIARLEERLAAEQTRCESGLEWLRMRRDVGEAARWLETSCSATPLERLGGSDVAVR